MVVMMMMMMEMKMMKTMPLITTMPIMRTMLVLVSSLMLSVLETILINVVSSTITKAMFIVQSLMRFPWAWQTSCL